MKTVIFILFTTISVFFIVSCSYPLKDNTTKINITCRDCAGLEVFVTKYNKLPLGPEEVYLSRFNSSGRAEFEWVQNDTLSPSLVVGNKNHGEWKFYANLYTEPGATIDLTIKDGALEFDRDLKIINSYYAEINLIHGERVKYANKNYRNDASPLEKQAFLDSLMQFGKELESRIKGDNSISDYYRQMLISYNSLFETTQRMHFDTQVAYNNINNNDMSVALDSTLSGAFKDITIHSAFISHPFYIDHLSNRLAPVFYDILNYRDNNRVKTGEYEYVRKAVEKDPKLNDYRELIMALFGRHMSSNDLMDYDFQLKLTDLFRQDYPHSKYLVGLNHILKGVSEFRNGMPMKDLKMHDINGNVFKLSDLKGNLVYIDVWATWCGPCVDELKYAVKLSKKYSNYPDLKFLYVSIDQDTESWRTFLKKNSNIRGIQGIQDFEYLDSNHVTRLYKFNGIPRYILIDKKGNIVNANARRPSELLYENYLDSLLSL